MRPRIIQAEGQIGFYWTTPEGVATTLPDLVSGDDEPDRLVRTHLEALDDALVIAGAQFGDLLGGGTRPNSAERDDLIVLHRCLDMLVRDYALAAQTIGMVSDVRAGQIIGTAALFAIRARFAVDLLGPAPLDGELDEPPVGVLSGYGQMVLVDPDKPWKGGRWILKAESGRKYPLTLSTMLFDSSGVNKDAARREHREALQACVDAEYSEDTDAFTLACALDWLLYDWLMAHRDAPDSAAIQIPKGHDSDAEMIVRAAHASVRARAKFDPHLNGPATTPQDRLSEHQSS
ncbi:hypothetical protein [Mycolicibacterium brisbanense]|uniref:Uncharacterized protein n=1 Tax=Mycolicibacterium brisbanense TaxID=146020 RepID=A0A117I6X6_9MYCO|nr:hypothetical protein [Mycolicibacterium brisbanense]MCV7156486.1 hypothetical protein [Mycolicibacterium brisbanense]GAS90694.1 uncharacterized protein RMCB_4790 [Mycolicibacterium brisbanense]